ncbi:MAG: enoyl-CoA hydratase/isomerase family protein [Desulfuromonadales bacterium]|nr:enoyl-CoA hydratase/isomerase family protein [Desulfuromonadales bacterium]
MSSDTVLMEITEGLATVTLNRPRALNTLNRETLDALDHVVHELAERADVRVIIVTGSGSKSFCAGADIAMMHDLQPREAREFAVKGQRILRALECSSKPVIAAVNGYALGGGCELALSCDIRLASSEARFGQPEISIGTIPGFGGTQRLSRVVGKSRALELLLTGDKIDAREAVRIGLANRVVAQEDLLYEATELAKKIQQKSGYAVALCKESVNRGLDLDLDQACALEAQLFGLSFASHDQKEGMAAFLEKRQPIFLNH